MDGHRRCNGPVYAVGLLAFVHPNKAVGFVPAGNHAIEVVAQDRVAVMAYHPPVDGAFQITNRNTHRKRCLPMFDHRQPVIIKPLHDLPGKMGVKCDLAQVMARAQLAQMILYRLGVNDRAQLAEAAAHMRDRINAGWLAQGVSMLDPNSVWIDVDVDLAPDVMLLPQTFLHGPTSIASGARIGPGVTLTSCEVGEEAQIRHAVADLAVIGPRATVGPYTYLRPGTRLGEGAKAGSYVEIKNAEVGDGAKVPHLSYVGDAQIGEGTNIGAATVFVNYDGATKHHTVVGRHVRIGSDTMLVAPVTIGDGAYTAAGSVITEDVPPGSMAVGRARQRNIDGWVARRRAESPSAQAAEAAQRQEESS